MNSHNSRLVVPPLAIFAVMLVAWMLLSVGCTGKKTTTTTNSGIKPAQRDSDQDHFDLAMDFLSRLEEFEPSRVDPQIQYHLNRWIETADDSDTWQRDTKIDDLPSETRELTIMIQLGDSKFDIEDVRFLKQAYWSRTISEWVSSLNPNAELQSWLEQNEAIDGDSRNELVVAELLFDWVVRNIQLDELLPNPKGPAAGPSVAGNADLSANVSPPRRGIPGPGYTQSPGETLFYGHGDQLQRARLFIAMTRQQKIDTVMLAIRNEKNNRLEPWIPAVFVNEQFYLFDPSLGMPIPGPDQSGIATLKQVREDAALLDSLDFGSKHPYPIKHADLERVEVLIDASPQTLSKRMKTLEARLTGRHQMALTVAPSDFSKRLRDNDLVARVHLWNLPFETYMFRNVLQHALARNDRLRARYMREVGIFQTLHPLVQGRMKYFRGRFQSTDDEKGAREYFLNSRLPDSQINELPNSFELQRQMGLEPLRERPRSPEKKNTTVANVHNAIQRLLDILDGVHPIRTREFCCRR